MRCLRPNSRFINARNRDDEQDAWIVCGPLIALPIGDIRDRPLGAGTKPPFARAELAHLPGGSNAWPPAVD